MTYLDVYGERVFDPPLFLTFLLLAGTDNHQRRVINQFLVFLLPPASAIWGLYSRSARLNFTFGYIWVRVLTCNSCATAIPGVGTVQRAPCIVGVHIKHLEAIAFGQSGEAVEPIGCARLLAPFSVQKLTQD
jgi:hypothetical protein